MKFDLTRTSLFLASVIAVLLGVLFSVPALADLIKAPKNILVPISTNATGADIEANDTFVALIYHSTAVGGQGVVYVKSATDAEGWLASVPLGFGAQTRLAFDPSANVVYAVWKDGSANPETIKYGRCSLDPINPPDCTTGLIYTAPANETLQATDIVVGGDGTIHVAWENLTLHQIFTAQATTASPGMWTPSSVPKSGGKEDSRPVIAWSNNAVHLAFLRGTLATQPNEVRYLRNDKNTGTYSHSWNSPNASKSFIRNTDFAAIYDYVASRPTLAASGSRVYLAWDAFSTSATGTDPQKHFGLMRATSSNNGDNGTWSAPSLVTSDDNALSSPAADKFSYLSGPPVEQIALRPRLVISGTGFATVWQASPDASGCSTEPPGFSTANAIYFATHNGASWGTRDVLADNSISHTSNLAPDIAVPPGGPPSGWKGHFVFMRDPITTNQCAGGNYPEYILYYWGPFTKTFRDQGEPKIYLPVMLKNK